MAPVLVCPECSAKHPLGEVGDRTAFPCTGCGRQLKVPAGAGAKQTVPPSAAPLPDAPPPRRSRPAPEPATSVLPVAERAPAPPVVVTAPPAEPIDSKPPAAANGKSARDPIPSRAVRFLLWIVAVPLAFAVVLPLARGFGGLTSNQIQDLALAEGWGRFWPIVRLLPFIALAAAAFVQGGTYGLAKLRERQWAKAAVGNPTSNGTRPPRQPPTPRRPQSSRTRA